MGKKLRFWRKCHRLYYRSMFHMLDSTLFDSTSHSSAVAFSHTADYIITVLYDLFYFKLLHAFFHDPPSTQKKSSCFPSCLLLFPSPSLRLMHRELRHLRHRLVLQALAHASLNALQMLLCRMDVLLSKIS